MRTFGLIGYPLSHSFSQKYFIEKFQREKIEDAEFKTFSIPSINDVKKIIEKNDDLKGFALTIPYKKSIINFLNEKDFVVEQTQACNCVKIKNNKLIGFNTDVIGFEKSFMKNLQPHQKKALIIGTGGGAAAVEFVLKKLQIGYAFVSRKKNKKTNVFLYDDLSKEVMQQYQIIINATPVGMYPNINEAPAIPYQYLTSENYLFDLIYNPAKTKFLLSGEEKNATIKNGYEMLVIQAEENWKIWNE
ncbi:MAG: shikimate dehydrogenase family protein [Chitinophagaceae bacterium]